MKEGACGPTCMCGCGCGWPRGHRMFRVVLGRVILLGGFWGGLKVGEFTTMIENNSVYGFRGGYTAGYYYPQGGMMRFVNGGYSQTQTQAQQAPMIPANGTSTSGVPVQ